MRTFRAFYFFCGIGGGAIGQMRSRAHLFGREARFEVAGGVDIDADACADFEMFTGKPALCADIARMTPAELLAYCEECPDMVFMSAPCKGASGLLSASKAKTKKYRELNRLALRALELMLATWKQRPKLVLFENVPRLKQRAGGMLRRVRKLLRSAGYVFTDGFHDCGELGGLAQVRRRYLLVARHKEQVPPLLYQPPKKRVRGCGEVLGQLPLPGDPAGGPMHALPKLSWLNWVRLALIPAGGDWRDLDDVLRTGQPKREVFRRHHVAKWKDPSVTIAGTGSNGPSAVADPRPKEWFGNVLRVKEWDEPAATVTAGNGVTNGGGAVADPRFGNVDRVTPWDEAVGTITHAPAPSSGGAAVADPRLPEELRFTFSEKAHRNKYKVGDWDDSAPTVIGATRPGSGAPSVADPRFGEGLDVLRVKRAFDHGYGVLRQDEPSSTVAGGSQVGQGAYSVADGRYRGTYGVLEWSEPAPTVTGNGRATTGAFSVADLRFRCTMRGGTYGVMSWQQAAATIRGSHDIGNAPAAVADPRFPSLKKPPLELQIIISADGTWHRPITTWELMALQSVPVFLNGTPVVLAGKSHSKWRERVGNCVPPDAAEAIGDQMLVCLLQAELGGFSLASPDTPVWIQPEQHVHG